MPEVQETMEELLYSLTASVVRLVVSARMIGRASSRKDVETVSVYEIARAIRQGMEAGQPAAGRDRIIKGFLDAVMNEITWSRFNGAK